METTELEKINNKLSRKRIEFYEIIGKCNSKGELKITFCEPQKYNENFDYYVSLLRFEASSFFPNLTNQESSMPASRANNMFYFSEKGVDKTVKFETGAYDVEEYSKILQEYIPENSITIELLKGNGKCLIKLKTGYKVDFTKTDTWRNVLGFESKILNKPLNISDRMVNVLETQKVFIYLDIIRGSWFNNLPTNILYSFANESEYGYPINLKTKNKEPHILLNKSFNSVLFTFKDENNNPIDFQGSSVSLTLEVAQV